MSEYFIFSTYKKHSKTLGRRIEKAVRAIHPDLSWTGPVSIPGNHLTGWLSRPNDGSNNYGFRIEENQRAQSAVCALLTGK